MAGTRIRGALGAMAALVLVLLAACSAVPQPAPSGAPISPLTQAPSSRLPVALEPGDWPTYHHDAARTGAALNLPPMGALSSAWSARLDGAVYGEPLVVRGRVIVATESDTLYALDPADGHVVWRRNVGTPVPGSALPCGDISPLGITGTPVYDAATGLVFAVAEVSGGRHELVGLDAGDGALIVRREVEPPQGDHIAYQQRAALTVLDGRVYVAFGGLDGDCSDYVGTVLSVPTTGSGALGSYVVPTPRLGGIWAPGGSAVDGSRLLVPVGNGDSVTTYDGSDAVLSLDASLKRTDFFAPSSWAQDNADDADLGSMTPVRVGAYVFADGKNGVGYVLDAGHFGGVGGAASQTPVCPAFGAPAVAGMTVYVPCQDGLQEVAVSASGTMSLGWRLPLGAAGSPVIGGGEVWVTDYATGELYALDPGDGHVRQKVQVGPVPHFVTPTLSGGRVFVGTLDGVSALAGA
ncbi:outer membrane protein assembly factor BamB family protein [Sinomonas terrae]|uniref:PQQ-binding-like beta-propeller repeat protein n=1 Tax=Sinomonas terrae TaxID=2908838 RepID=A0ABS9U643_9MICC|nr:PQQ-binding-like beta-propeller repeat protein [Sinomonas terrae]MCH6471745.1 PQQ-binding-like beta-propeller repeat protein [Sinomonas terrae]